MSLKDTLPLEPGYDTTGEGPAWLVKELPARGGISKRINAPTTLEMKFNPVRAKASDVGKMQAQKFGDLLKAGYKPAAAAHRLHTTVRELMSKEDTQKMVKEIVEGYHLEAKARALLQRALVNKGMIENSTVEGDAKLLLDYLKLAADDKETGIKDAGQVNVNVGVDPALKAVLETIPLPEIEAPVEETVQTGETVQAPDVSQLEEGETK